jgi:hypothetical protein
MDFWANFRAMDFSGDFSGDGFLDLFWRRVGCGQTLGVLFSIWIFINGICGR